MVPQSKKFKPAYARVLVRIAAGDLASAEALLKTGAGRPENVVYLAQQAVEKALKAALCAVGLPVPFTHDVETLLAVLPENVARPPDEAALPALTEFATVRRYEEGFYELTQDEMNATLQAAHRVIAWAKTLAK